MNPVMENMGRCDGKGRGQGSVRSRPFCLIGLGSIRRAEVDLIRSVCRQLHFQASSLQGTAVGMQILTLPLLII